MSLFLLPTLTFSYCASEIIRGNHYTLDVKNIYDPNITWNVFEQLKQYHEYKLQQFYRKRKYWTTSTIGHSMFKDFHRNSTQKKKQFLIYVWQHWYDWFNSRHMQNRDKRNPLAVCGVKNCRITSNYKKLKRADAVVINVQPGFIPQNWSRKPSQRYVFLSDESPKNMFSTAVQKPDLNEWGDYFNWTMTYRTDSDVPVPYGRTLPLPIPKIPYDIPSSITKLIPHWKSKRKDVLVTILISSCHFKHRMRYIRQLRHYIPVHIYGKCSLDKVHKTICPGRWIKDCKKLKEYKFYLAFENSGCRQYITEKTFHHAFMKGAIPIIMGAPKEDCYKLLPPHSFIYADDFASPKELSDYIRYINEDKQKLLYYHQWRRFFKIVNEHGYAETNSYSICRLCEALNFNDPSPKVYRSNDLKLFYDFDLLCHY